MAKRWKVEISELGASEPLFLGMVEAPTWPAALQGGRREIGESGGVPAGASCNVNPNGTVTIQDARQRRRYQILPAKEPAPPPGTKRPAQSSPELPPPPPEPVPLRRETSRPPLAMRAERANELRRDPGMDGRPAPGPSPSAAEHRLILLAARDEEPTTSSPIHFRERMYAVPGPLEEATGEKWALKLLQDLQEEVREGRAAKFIRIELFDHVWDSNPTQPAVVRLEWKDWTGSIDIEFPLGQEDPHCEIPLVSSVPPKIEDRLSAAFEACHDLLFLKNRAEALEFAVHLLEELVPCEATAAFLLDVNTDELRVVAARGTGAPERRGRAFPASVGLLGAATRLAEHAVLVLADAPADPRYDENIDGIPGMDIRALLYRPLIHKGRLFGALQLANGITAKTFTEADCEVVDYITQQLSVFVAKGASIPKLNARLG